MNHTNPVWDATSAEALEVAAAGFLVGRQGMAVRMSPPAHTNLEGRSLVRAHGVDGRCGVPTLGSYPGGALVHAAAVETLNRCCWHPRLCWTWAAPGGAAAAAVGGSWRAACDIGSFQL
eukprot:364978-Chlamydomonas_euryale.AAC.4